MANFVFYKPGFCINLDQITYVEWSAKHATFHFSGAEPVDINHVDAELVMEAIRHSSFRGAKQDFRDQRPTF